MTKVEALKNLYVALGGDATEVATNMNIAEMIDIIGNVASGGSGGLTVKTANLKTVVPDGNKGLVLIDKSDLPDDFAGMFNILQINQYTESSGGIINIGAAYLPMVRLPLTQTNPKYTVNIYKLVNSIPSFESSDLAPAGTKIYIDFEYLAKEE